MRHSLKILYTFILFTVSAIGAGLHAQTHFDNFHFGLGGADRYAYTTERPLIIVCDWHKQPYEFCNDAGQPAGYNIDILTAILDDMEIPYQLRMNEWSKVVEDFMQGKADIIIDNVRRYRNDDRFAYTHNVINYNRLYVATSVSDSSKVISTEDLNNSDGTVFYSGDYTPVLFYRRMHNEDKPIKYESAKVALDGLEAGRYRYFLWGEQQLRWKIKEFGLGDKILLHETKLPIGKIHIIGYDKKLISEIDARYSRMNQDGEIEAIYNKWFHPERVRNSTSPMVIYISAIVLILAIVIYIFNIIAKKHIRNITRNSTDASAMIYNVLRIGKIYIMEYDIKNNLFLDRHGSILPEKGLTLQAFTSQIHPDEQDEFRTKMKSLIEGREHLCELRKRWNAGTAENPKWHCFRGYAVMEGDKKGRPRYIINIINDITDNVEEEQRDLTMSQYLKVIFNMPELAMAFYSRDGRLVAFNNKMKAMYGFDNPDNERFWRTVRMYDIPLIRDAYPQESTYNLQVCQIMNHPGLGTKSYFESHLMPVRNEEGEITQFLYAIEDMGNEQKLCAEIKRYRRRLKEIHQAHQYRNERLYRILTDSHIYIFEADLATRTMSFSHSLKEVEYKLTFDEFIELMAEDENVNPDNPFSNVENYLDGSSDKDGRFIVIYHFKKHSYSYTGYRRYDSQGNVIGYAGIAADITDLMEAQKRLQETTALANDSISLKNAFLANMTHELRTPLNAVVGFTTILQMTDAPEERDELIKIILDSCDMLQRLINDLLEASSITTEGPTSIKPTDVDFADSFDTICLTLRQRVEQANLQFITENPYDRFFTSIDVERVQQIITNFVTNAVKFTSQGYIRIGYRYERDGLYIYCKDTGKGIPKDKQAVIFERFVKLDEFIQGTGMGLAICKYIVERLGGEIGVESEGDGAGSTFWIWIPCSPLTHI